MTVDDIKIGTKCPILGTTFKVGRENWGDSPSLERIDKNRGYEPDNVMVVSMMANLIRNQATPHQIKQVGDFYEHLYRKKLSTLVDDIYSSVSKLGTGEVQIPPELLDSLLEGIKMQ